MNTTPLKDFDIALSLNQRGLCCQFKEAWRVWNRRAATPFTILATPLNHLKQPSTTRLQAKLGTPKLSLDAQRMASQEVLTTFELLDGKLAYMSGSDPIELPIHNYSLSIRSMVRKRTVSREQLYKHNRHCAEEVNRQLEHFKLAEGQFSIECLFLTLTRPEALMIPQLQAPGGATLSSEARGQLVACIETWIADSGIHGPNGLLLMASVVPRAAKRPPSLFMEDYLFRLVREHVAGVEPDLTHSIDYLCVTEGGHTLPEDAARQDALCRSQGIWPSHMFADGSDGLFAGLMVLRKDLFIQHLLNSLRQALKREVDHMAQENRLQANAGKLKHPELDFLEVLSFERDGNSLFLQGSKHYQWKDGDLKLVLDKHLKLEIKLVEGNRFLLDGRLHGHLDRDRTTSWDMHSRATATRNTDIGGSMSLSIQGEGAKCSVVPVFAPTFTAVPGKDDDQGDTWAITQFFTRINNSWDVGIAGDWLGASRDAIIGMLEGVFRDVNLEMGNLAFVPPGEETFFFREPRFNQHLDLVFNVFHRDV